jgi:uncharacterized protein (DUF983 family)
MQKISFPAKILQILKLRCPKCGQGNVFKKDKTSFKFFPEMSETCEKCGHHYDREPVYFLGAMYASYGLSVFEGIISFVLVYFLVPELPTFFMALIPALVIVILSGQNYKLGRVIWMNLFPR